MYNHINFNKEATLVGDSLTIFLTSLPTGQSSRAKILDKYGVLPEPGHDYKLENVLKAYHEVGDTVGARTLYMIGKGVASLVPLPPDISLKDTLKNINLAYHQNHKINGNEMFDPKTGQMTDGIGHYRLTSYSEEKKEAIMECTNPYPSKFDEGILVQLARKSRPKGSIKQDIKLDSNKPMRDKGGTSCTYIINW